MADIPLGRLTNISLPDAYGKRMFIQQKAKCHSYILWTVDQAVCSSSVCIRLFLPQHKKSHLLVKARIGGQMLITESSKICDLYIPQLYSVWTSSACVPFTQ